MVKQIESVEGVACNLSDCPHHHKQDHTLLILDLKKQPIAVVSESSWMIWTAYYRTIHILL